MLTQHNHTQQNDFQLLNTESINLSHDAVDNELDWHSTPLSNPNAHIRLATLFSGIGAVEQAVKRLKLNHSIVFAGDIDPHVKNSYFENYPMTEKNWHNDITTFDASPYKNQVDLLVGGSPCQAFSMVGKRLGLEDTRGTLFYDFARVVKEVKPIRRKIRLLAFLAKFRLIVLCRIF